MDTKQSFEMGTYFKVRWYAKKYHKIITRNATWDRQCKAWNSLEGIPCLTFNNYDAKTSNKYRTATNYAVLKVNL